MLTSFSSTSLAPALSSFLTNYFINILNDLLGEIHGETVEQPGSVRFTIIVMSEPGSYFEQNNGKIAEFLYNQVCFCTSFNCSLFLFFGFVRYLFDCLELSGHPYSIFSRGLRFIAWAMVNPSYHQTLYWS